MKKLILFTLFQLVVLFSYGASMSGVEKLTQSWYENNVETVESPKARFLSKLFPPEVLTYIVTKCSLYNLKPSIVLSQMFIESKHSKHLKLSKRAEESNNFFGIKYGKFDSIVTTRHYTKTKEYIRGRWVNKVLCFSVFQSVNDCIDAYFQIILKHNGISPNGNLTKAMYKKYATDPGYVKLVHDVAKSNNFYAFDHIITYANN